jgi:hypothetical protein
MRKNNTFKILKRNRALGRPRNKLDDIKLLPQLIRHEPCMRKVIQYVCANTSTHRHDNMENGLGDVTHKQSSILTMENLV